MNETKNLTKLSNQTALPTINVTGQSVIQEKLKTKVPLIKNATKNSTLNANKTLATKPVGVN
jgi:hypothetical protein